MQLSLELLQDLLDQNPDGIIIISVNTDAKIQIEYSNPAIGKILSINDNEDLCRFLTKEEIFISKVLKCNKSGESFKFEKSMQISENEKWLSFNIQKIDNQIVVRLRDSTSLKSARIEKRNTEKMYQQLFEESLDPIFLLDENFRIIDSNSALISTFNTDVKISSLFNSQNDFKSFKTSLEKDRLVQELEIGLLDKEQKIRLCLINCVRIYDELEKETSYIGVVRDITERKNAEKQMLNAEKLLMTGKIARSIAHEIRNPLTNINLSLEQLKDEVPNEVEDADLYFTIIERNTERIGTLISDLLNSSKPKELQLKEHSIVEVLREAIEMVDDRLKLLKIEKEVHFQDNLPNVLLDSEQFKIAILNLLINAIEAMKPEKGILKLYIHSIDNDILIIIEDNGKGISKESISNLFEPFFSQKKEGSGLGLTTVQNIIHSHNGNIDVESEVGKGTKFILCIPGYSRKKSTI